VRVQLIRADLETSKIDFRLLEYGSGVIPAGDGNPGDKQQDRRKARLPRGEAPVNRGGKVKEKGKEVKGKEKGSGKGEKHRGKRRG
jgi:hypothetical protein